MSKIDDNAKVGILFQNTEVSEESSIVLSSLRILELDILLQNFVSIWSTFNFV